MGAFTFPADPGERGSTRMHGENESFVFQTYTRSDAHHMLTVTFVRRKLILIENYTPQNPPPTPDEWMLESDSAGDQDQAPAQEHQNREDQVRGQNQEDKTKG